MVALILTGLFCAAVTLGFRGLLAKWLDHLDPQEAFGVAGLVGLGLVGTATVALGLIPGFLKPAMFIVGGGAILLAALALKKFGATLISTEKPEKMGLAGALAIAAMAVFPAVASQVPSTQLDWDSLAYHLAVPKLWLEAGQVTWVQTIHHSNFPFALDALYLYGESWGGEYSAKAFMFYVMLLGARALFGLARRWGAGGNAVWAPVAFMASPVVLWESGTAYIDAGHGLFAGLGILYVAEMVHRIRKSEDLQGLAFVAALCWGLALGTKLTGLQSFAIAGFVFILFSARRVNAALKPAAIVAGIALAVAGVWFAKSTAFTGNPVFPFFYEQFGGKGWDQWRADIYRNEQNSFGVGRAVDSETGKSHLQPAQIGNAILGLAYQPGRYTNPAQTAGGGFPTGSIGFLTLLTMVFWAVSGRAGPKEKVVLAWAALSLLLWFFLSQQSRYLTFLVIPSAVMVATGVGRLQLGKALAGAAALQALATVSIVVQFGFADQFKVVTGNLTPEAYRKAGVPFAPMAQVINANTQVTEVALFDEVFGFLLDKKYFWANPGHSNRLDFQSMADGGALADEFKKQGVSHVYFSLATTDRANQSKWLAAAGLIPAEPWSGEERQAMLANRELAWKVLLADAVRSGRLTVASEPISPRGLLFKVE